MGCRSITSTNQPRDIRTGNTFKSRWQTALMQAEEFSSPYTNLTKNWKHNQRNRKRLELLGEDLRHLINTCQLLLITTPNVSTILVAWCWWHLHLLKRYAIFYKIQCTVVWKTTAYNCRYAIGTKKKCCTVKYSV